MKRHRPTRNGRAEGGNALAGFAMTAPGVILVFFALMSLAFTLHVRTIAIDAAAEGARVAAQTGSLGAGQARTAELLTTSLGSEYASDVRAQWSTQVQGAAEITIACPVPVLGLAVAGPSLMEVSADARPE